MIRFTGKTRWMALVALAVLIAVGAALLLTRAPQVQVVQMQPRPLVRTLQFSARVATLSRVDIGSTLTGRVVQVRVREGAQVKRGELLIQLETDELKAALGQAVAAQKQAETTLQVARVSLERGQKLVTQGFYSAAQLDEAQRAVDVAQAQLGSAQAALVAARARLEQAALVSPADARVLSRAVEPGQIVQPGRALMSLALAGPTLLSAQVDERFLDQLRTGQKAMVVADAFLGQRFAAKLLSIAPLVDAQRGAIEVKFTLDGNVPDFLREDMTLSIEVETGRRESALVLPLAALRGRAGVLVVEDGIARERTLRLGLRTLDAAEVLTGLEPGELVVVQRNTVAGQRLRAQLVDFRAATAAPGAIGGDAGSALTNAIGR